MNGTISISPDPPSRGSSIDIKVSGGSPGQHTLTLEDECGVSFDVDITVAADGTGTASATIPATWGITLTISAPGFDDLNTIVN